MQKKGDGQGPWRGHSAGIEASAGGKAVLSPNDRRPAAAARLIKGEIFRIIAKLPVKKRRPRFSIGAA